MELWENKFLQNLNKPRPWKEGKWLKSWCYELRDGNDIIWCWEDPASGINRIYVAVRKKVNSQTNMFPNS